ncbi:hypothetical protein [Vibrio owensii]|uniref:hypothetical protein n=1 Tax=Vibrio owensii TaxID=696485 RepID=UPI002FEF1760
MSTKKRFVFSFVGALVCGFIAMCLGGSIASSEFEYHELALPDGSGSATFNTYDNCDLHKPRKPTDWLVGYRCYSGMLGVHYKAKDSVNLIKLASSSGFMLFQRSGDVFAKVKGKSSVCKSYPNVVECTYKVPSWNRKNRVINPEPKLSMYEEFHRFPMTWGSRSQFMISTYSPDNRPLGSVEYELDLTNYSLRDTVEMKVNAARAFVVLTLVFLLFAAYQAIKLTIAKAKQTKTIVVDKVSERAKLHAKQKEEARIASLAKEEAVRAQVRDGMSSSSKAKEDIMNQIRDALDDDNTEPAKSLSEVLKKMD